MYTTLPDIEKIKLDSGTIKDYRFLMQFPNENQEELYYAERRLLWELFCETVCELDFFFKREGKITVRSSMCLSVEKSVMCLYFQHSGHLYSKMSKFDDCHFYTSFVQDNLKLKILIKWTVENLQIHFMNDDYVFDKDEMTGMLISVVKMFDIEMRNITVENGSLNTLYDIISKAYSGLKDPIINEKAPDQIIEALNIIQEET